MNFQIFTDLLNNRSPRLHDTSTSVRVIFYGLSIFLSYNIVERIFLYVLVPSLRNLCFHTHILPLRIRTDLPWVLLITIMIVLMMLLRPHIEAPTMTLLFLQHSLIHILLCTSNYLKSTVACMMWREMNVCTENPKGKKDRAGMTWSSRQLARQENIEVR